MLIDELVERLAEAGFRVPVHGGRFMAADRYCVGGIVESIPVLALLFGPQRRPDLAVYNLATRFSDY